MGKSASCKTLALGCAQGAMQAAPRRAPGYVWGRQPRSALVLVCAGKGLHSEMASALFPAALHGNVASGLPRWCSLAARLLSRLPAVWDAVTTTRQSGALPKSNAGHIQTALTATTLLVARHDDDPHMLHTVHETPARQPQQWCCGTAVPSGPLRPAACQAKPAESVSQPAGRLMGARPGPAAWG